MTLGLGCYPQANAGAVERARPAFALVMKIASLAEWLRDNVPGCYLILRPDDGDDEAQVPWDQSVEAIVAAWMVRVRTQLARAKAGTYSACLGPCEHWPDRADKPGIAKRAAIEIGICEVVEALGLDYVALSCAVGHLDVEDVATFAPVFRRARWIGYHGYTAPTVSAPDAETGPDHFWRPTRIWLPELRKLGIPLRLMLTEIGTYYPWEQHGLDKERAVAYCRQLDQQLTDECRREGVEYGGSIPFGLGTEGKLENWRLDGYESQIAAGGRYPTVPAAAADATNSEDGPTMTKQRLWLALIPSCQPNPVLGGISEHQQMHTFARLMRDVAARYSAVVPRVFTALIEKDNVNFPNLRGQIVQANDWLNTAPVGTATLMFHLHTNSGTASSVGVYYGNEDIQKRLASQLEDALSRCFYTSKKTGQNYETLGYFAWTVKPGRHLRLILELGSHENAEDTRRIREYPEKISTEIVETTLRFLSLPTTHTEPVVAVPPIDDALNGLWHFLTIAETAPTVEVARANATLAKGKIVALKAAIGVGK